MHWKRLWSAALDDYVRVRVQARVLRTIDKVGGLDEYLLGDKAARIKELGMGGWVLRWKLIQTKAVAERFDQERKRMGVPTGSELPAAMELRREGAKEKEKAKARTHARVEVEAARGALEAPL